MALGALTLSVTSGVQGRRFAARINGLSTGRLEIGVDGAPGFATVNGMLYSNALPYPTSTVSLIEYDPGAVVSRKETRIDIVAATPDQIAAQALSTIAAGRALSSYQAAANRQADGSLVYAIYAIDNFGVIASLPIGQASSKALTFNDGTPLQFSDGTYLELAA